MATNLPLWRLTVYKPYAEDATESTVLTPIGGSSHSDPFVVTTLAGITGAQPYLEAPSGRQGSFDPITRKLSVGNLTARVFDPRVTVGGSNATRWVSAFLGDVAGRTRLKGCKFLLERSIDYPTVPLAPYFAGRIRNVSLDGVQRFSLDLVDSSFSLGRSCFVGAPESSVTYAAPTSLLPLGLPLAYGGFAATPLLTGSLVSQFDTATARNATLRLDASVDPVTSLITKVYAAGATDASLVRRVVVTFADGSTVTLDLPASKARVAEQAVGLHRRPVLLNVLTRAGRPFADIPSGTSPVSFRIIQDMPPTTTLPLLIADVHPVQLMADIIDGKFSVSSSNPTPRPLGTRDTSGGGPWATLLADASFGLKRFVIDKAWKANEFIEQQICVPYGLGYRQDAQGRVVPFDMRQQASVTTVAAFTDVDVVENGTVTWSDARDGAITAVEYHSYWDDVRPASDITNVTDVYPDISPSGIRTTESIILRLNDLTTLGDVGEKIIKINATGSRQMNVAPPVGTISTFAGDIAAAITDYLAPFQNGAIRFSVPYRVSSAAAGVSVGQYVTANHAKHPNPATNQRGGARLALVVGRTEQDGTVTLDLLDYGAANSAAAPTFTSAAIDTTDGSIINAVVAANAAGDDVAVWACVTATSIGARPVDTDDGWFLTGRRSGSGSLACAPFPAGKRVWLRARSQAIGVAANAPSTWVYPVTPAAGYLDLPAITVSLTVTPDATDGSRCVLAWTLSTPLATDVYVRLTSATVNPAAVSLLKGSTGYTVEGLTAITNYTVTLQHRDAAGSVVATQTATFTTSANVPVLAVPDAPTVFAGPQGNPLAAQDGSYGLAVVATVLPGSVEFQEAVETAVGSGVYGTASTIARGPAILGDWTSIVRIAPNDGLRRQLSARSVRGATSSAWTSALAVQPWTVVKLPVYSGPVVPRLSPFTYVDTETTRVFSWTRNSAAYAVWVYDNLVSVGGVDPYDTPGAFPTTVLIAGTDTYTAQKPPAHMQRFVHFVPYSVNNIPGDIRHEPIDPAASALSGTVKAAVTGGTADLTLHIAGSASNWPVAVDLFEDNPDGTPIYSTSVSAVTDIAPAGIAALTARPLPLRELRRWYLRLIDVAGVKTWGIGSADRDALPNGSVTAADNKALPALTATYDDDTDQIRVTTPTGKTKTVSGLSGSGVWTYTVGDVLDDASVETALTPGEVRSPYLVEFHGGLIWVPFFKGPLHGAPILALAGRARVTATDATTVTVRYAVADPIPQGANSATITYQDQGSGGVSPSSGGTVTPGATITEAAGTYIDYTITRPAFGAGTARVTFTATAANRVSDSDAVDVPEQQTMTLSLSVGNCTASNAGALGPPWNRLVVAFTATGFPTGTTYDVSYNNGVANGMDSQNVSASPATFNGVTFGGSPGSGAVSVVAKLPSGSTATAIKNKPYLT